MTITRTISFVQGQSNSGIDVAVWESNAEFFHIDAVVA